jgi:hypothetical protein
LRGLLVSASGRPNRYTPFLAVRSSRDRRPAFVISATEDEGFGGVRVWLGFTGAHLGLLGDDLAVAFSCGASEKLSDVVGEANVDAAGS